MARRKDADKRQLILGEAKRMFAGKGYDATSMAALAKHIGIPVGSLYTYFESKEALLNTIIEEGWNEFFLYLQGGLGSGAADRAAELGAEGGSSGGGSSGGGLSGGGLSGGGALSRLAFLVRKALPELFKDLDLIAILLAQADQSSRLGEKLEQLAFLVDSIIMDFRKAERENAGSGIPNLKTGLAVMLLGSLETMRLIHRAGIDIGMEDVIAFLVLTIEGALGCSLPAICEPGDPLSTTAARSGSPACADAAGG